MEENKGYTVSNVQELMVVTNDQLEDILFISEEVHIPEKKNIRRCYRSDFELKTKEEVKELVKQKKAILYHKEKEGDFFVYNERAGELLPFKKNDYLIYDRGYFTFDGKDYISYDDNGIEIGRFNQPHTHELR